MKAKHENSSLIFPKGSIADGEYFLMRDVRTSSLLLYNKEQYKKFVDRVNAIDSLPNAKSFKRIFLGSCIMVDIKNSKLRLSAVFNECLPQGELDVSCDDDNIKIGVPVKNGECVLKNDL